MVLDVITWQPSSFTLRENDLLKKIKKIKHLIKNFISFLRIMFLYYINQLLLIAASMKEFHSIALYLCNSIDNNLIFYIILSNLND